MTTVARFAWVALAVGILTLGYGCADEERIQGLERELARSKANEQALEAALAEANEKIEAMNSRILDAQGALYQTYGEQESALEDLEEEDTVDDPR